MSNAMSNLAIGGFGDLWLYSGKETTASIKPRDLRRAVVAAYPCETCRAEKGVACHRVSAAGVIVRGLPHFGRGKNRGSRGGCL
jgi:hypothetical protein